MKLEIFVFIFLLTYSLANAILVQNLGGTGWTAINANKSIKISAHVPGSIYSDLARAKVIPADIYRDLNDVQLRWFSYDNWTYEQYFDVDHAELLSSKHIYLTAHGLDTIGQVHLNGHLLGSVDNMFVRYKWNIKEHLKPANNQISVSFQSAPIVAQKLYDKILKEKYSIPSVCVKEVQSGECHVNMLRKMQASFSWDWGPAFPTQGIWRPIQIEAFNELVLQSVSVYTVKNSLDHWTLNYTIHLEGPPSTTVHGDFDLYLDEKTHIDTRNFSLLFDANGEASIKQSVVIDDKLAIKAWYPNGLGEQKMYNLTVSLRTSLGETTSKSIRVGFRTVELTQNRLQTEVEAYSFFFTINGQAIYSKSSNWIPAHVLNEALSENYIRDLLKSAKLANMNMLRVWGGGIYESDIFYDIADEYGILIWQDMMFACGLYPTDEHFIDSVRLEIKQQVRRLQHHPSIVLWAGNNENEAALANDWFKLRASVHHKDYEKDYRHLYIDTIKPIIELEDTSRPFVASSPSNGVKAASENYLSQNPQTQLYGDVHYYKNSGNAWNWKVYPNPKFASEYGFQSWSSLQTLKKSISSEHLKYPLDRTVTHREHKAHGLENLNSMMALHMKLLSSTGNATITKLEHYIYLTQIFQAMAMKAQTEHYRRNREVSSKGLGNTMGALYWQLNDIWPTVSWASLEFGGKWKMLHYFMRNIFENLLVNAYVDNGELRVVIIRDDHIKEHRKYRLQIDVYDWSSLTPIYRHHVDAIETSPFSVTLGYHANLDHFLNTSKCPGHNHCFIEVSIFELNIQKSKNFLLVGEPKDAIGLANAQIQVKSISEPQNDPTDGGKVFTLVLETDHVAMFVWLDFHTDLTGIFSDNGFMMANQTLQLTFKTNHTITKEKLQESLLIRTLNNSESQ